MYSGIRDITVKKMAVCYANGNLRKGDIFWKVNLSKTIRFAPNTISLLF